MSKRKIMMNSIRLSIVITVLCMLVSACADVSSVKSKARSKATSKATSKAVPNSFGFVAVGDTGYVAEKSGLDIVAGAIKNYCVQADCRFGLMSGDNIYPNGAFANDGDAALFERRFTQPYGPLALLGEPFRLYAALGNHDWYNSRAGALAQVHFHETTPPFYMNGLFYTVRPAGLNNDVEVFVIDTEMLLSSHELPRFKINERGEMVATRKMKRGGHKNALPVTAKEKQQLDWFISALRQSKAKWKIVLGHHPLWQSRPDSKFAQSVKLRELLMPSLCRYADMYIAGHQHTMELHTDSCVDVNSNDDAALKEPPLVHLVSGAGAKVRKISPKFMTWQHSAYPQLQTHYAKGEQWGFSYVRIEDEQLFVRIVSVAQNGQFTSTAPYIFSNRGE